MVECARCLLNIRERHGSFMGYLGSAGLPAAVKSEEDIRSFWEAFPSHDHGTLDDDCARFSTGDQGRKLVSTWSSSVQRRNWQAGRERARETTRVQASG